MKQPTNRTKKRLLVVFLLFSLLIIVLAFCVGWVQVVKGEEYAAMAAGQQTRDVPIAAKRGTIYDREGEELAISAKAFSVWVRPERIWRGEDEVEQEIQATRTLEQISPLLGIPVDELKTLSKRDSVLVRIAKYQTKETADAIQELSLYGVELTEEVKRYYPLGAFAAQTLGSVTDDNVGLAGIELRYDSFLSGVSGRWIKSADVDGNGLAYGVEKYFGASDGLNVVLTIDSVIQHYVEKSIQEVLEQTEADRVWCMMMDPKTGDILAMAMLPEFDPNNPRTPLDEEEAAYLDGLSSEEKMVYWNKMWRNSLIS
ncbi:MAG TPA: stage V sporulation protein D, partial [Bacillota bacterium]|nr:stage V sporulation protein D [Bacillota bacterium]